jgi:hypothetical protein
LAKRSAGALCGADQAKNDGEPQKWAMKNHLPRGGGVCGGGVMQRRGPNAVRSALSYPLSRGGTTGKSRSHAKTQEDEEGGG